VQEDDLDQPLELLDEALLVVEERDLREVPRALQVGGVAPLPPALEEALLR